MDNMLTDQLLLARKIYAQGILFFQHPLQPLDDCYQVVFQGDRYQGIVGPNTPHEQLVKVRKDDVIIRVYFESRIHSLTGTLSTKDRYKRIYEIPLEVTVSNLAYFATNYFQKKDPAKQAIDTFKARFEQYVTGVEYTRVQSLVIPFAQWNTAWETTGIQLKQSGKTMFRADPQYSDPDVEAAKLQEQIRKQQATLELEKTIQILQDKIEQERKEIQKDFERREKTKEQIYTICYNLRQVAAEEITAVLKERIHEGFENGHTSSKISDEYFALLGLFEDRTHIMLDKSIIAGMFAEGIPQNDDDPDTEDNGIEDTEDSIEYSEVE